MSRLPDKYLAEHGIKPSVQRMAVMQYLMEHPVHPTVDEIFNGLSSSIPMLSKTTVYNTLRLFVEKGVANAIDIDGRNQRFDADITMHGHFRCLECGMITDLYPTQLESLRQVANDVIEGYQITDSQVYYKGYCPKCRNRGNRRAMEN